MWPDLSEFSPEEKYPAPGFRHRDGQPAFLFSSADARTVERHFDWMTKYGIDGVLVQRFVAGVQDPDSVRVLGYARTAANRTGRVVAVEPSSVLGTSAIASPLADHFRPSRSTGPPISSSLGAPGCSSCRSSSRDLVGTICSAKNRAARTFPDGVANFIGNSFPRSPGWESTSSRSPCLTRWTKAPPFSESHTTRPSKVISEH